MTLIIIKNSNAFYQGEQPFILVSLSSPTVSAPHSLPTRFIKRRFADKSGKLQSTPSMLKPRWPHLYPQNQWSLWVCNIIVISLLHGTSRRHVDWLVGMMRLDEWNHTGDIVMDNTQLFRALHFANGGWQWAFEMIEAHIKHDNPWCCCYGRSHWFRSF